MDQDVAADNGVERCGVGIVFHCASELRQRTDDLSEALEQQTATSEVLRVISSTPGELQPVFGSVLENATKLCEAKFANLYLCEGTGFRASAMYNAPLGFAEARRREPLIYPGPESTLTQARAAKRPVQIADISANEAAIELDSVRALAVNVAGARTVLAVPMVKEDETIGVINIYRQEVRPFTERQVELVSSFADQAVIAIENTRLLNELRESLEQQTATGEIFSAISGSMADTKPVFDAILRNLLRMFGTRFAAILLLQDGRIHLPAVSGEPGFERLTDHYPRPFDQTSIGGQAMILKETIQIAPVVDNPAVLPFGQQMARDFGYNSIIVTPMTRGDDVIGALATAHREPKPFTDKQVALLQNFAAQAVIPIENARLLNRTASAYGRVGAAAGRIERDFRQHGRRRRHVQRGAAPHRVELESPGNTGFAGFVFRRATDLPRLYGLSHRARRVWGCRS